MITLINGFSLAWWTGMIGGFFFLLLIITATIKQYNKKIFMPYQIPFTPLHHWFGWIALGFLFIHFLLVLFSTVFHVFF